MTRLVCLSLVLGSLVAAPGCSSCFGSNNCRRPSFMEFRSPCRGQPEPCHAPAPACGPACTPACDACGEGGAGGAGGAIMAPSAVPVVTSEFS